MKAVTLYGKRVFLNEYDEWLFDYETRLDFLWRYLKSDRKKEDDLLRINGYDIPHFNNGSWGLKVVDKALQECSGNIKNAYESIVEKHGDHILHLKRCD